MDKNVKHSQHSCLLNTFVFVLVLVVIVFVFVFVIVVVVLKHRGRYCSKAGVLAPHISRPVPVVVASGDVLQEARLPKTPSYNKQTTVQITTDQQENNHSTAILFLATLKGVDGPSATSEARSLVPCMPCIGSSCSEPSVTHS
jgi:hypothetical protein